MKLVVGATYEKALEFSESAVMFAVLAECSASTVRFKNVEPGYRFLVLDVVRWEQFSVGATYEFVRGANFFTGLRRLG